MQSIVPLPFTGIRDYGSCGARTSECLLHFKPSDGRQLTVLGKTRRQLHRIQRAQRQAMLWLDTSLAKMPYRLRAVRRSLRRRFDILIEATDNRLLARLKTINPVRLSCTVLVALAFLFAFQRQPPQTLRTTSVASIDTTTSDTLSIQLASHATDTRNVGNTIELAAHPANESPRTTPTTIAAETQPVPAAPPASTGNEADHGQTRHELMTSLTSSHQSIDGPPKFPGEGGETIDLGDYQARNTNRKTALPQNKNAAARSESDHPSTTTLIDTREAARIQTGDKSRGEIVQGPHSAETAESIQSAQQSNKPVSDEEQQKKGDKS